MCHLPDLRPVLSRTVVRVQLALWPEFVWRDSAHGASLRWHIWVEDSEGQALYHSELWTLTRKMMAQAEHRLAFTIPIFEPLPAQYYVRCALPHALSRLLRGGRPWFTYAARDVASV